MARLKIPCRARFSLQAMLVATTLLGIAFAWLFQDWRKIRERNAVAAWCLERDALAGPPIQQEAVISYFSTSVPWYRRMIGDQGSASWISIRSHCTEAERERVHRVFPEAKIFIRVR